MVTTHIKKHKIKITNMILLIIATSILLYIAHLQGWIQLSLQTQIVLEEQADIVALDMKEKSYIGVNDKQIYKVTADGISSYDFTGEEVWSDTFSVNDVIVRQRTPFIAVGGKNGRSIIIFNQKGRQTEINTNNPIVYFSINKEGRLVVIEESEKAHIVTVYDKNGTSICSRTSNISTDGYPMVAELSPNGGWLLISYVSVNNPQVVSTIFAINTNDSQTEKLDNTKYGISQTDNLVYAIEFINDNTWVSIGDKQTTWYDLQGSEKESKKDLYSVFVPYLTEMSQYGGGYLPLVITQKPTQNVIHRQDQLVYFNEKGEEMVNLSLNTGVDSFYEDENGVILEYDDYFTGYNKLGKIIFKYKPTVNVSKVIYIPSLKKGIAVNKEKIILLNPKKERK